jgi:diguanylate cyclase (GGDEF)-like protein
LLAFHAHILAHFPTTTTHDPAITALAWPAPGPAIRACLEAVPGFAGSLQVPAAMADAWQLLQAQRVDLALLGPEVIERPGLMASLAHGPAVVLVANVGVASPEAWRAALEDGVQDVMLPGDWILASAPLRLLAAVLRQRRTVHARTAYATDLDTGLPHRQQLIEHMAHLLALREREPAPMALLVLRVEGLDTAAAQRGRQAAASLRRKLAVRLRAGLRASDVVAATGVDSYAVLLASVDAAADVEGVGAKLVAAVQRPFGIGGQPLALAVSLGVARYPDDGKDADGLLRAALADAAARPGRGRAGFVNLLERGPADAANDDNA